MSSGLGFMGSRALQPPQPWTGGALLPCTRCRTLVLDLRLHHLRPGCRLDKSKDMDPNLMAKKRFNTQGQL